MTINELSKEQFTELKWRYLDEIYQEKTNESILKEGFPKKSSFIFFGTIIVLNYQK